MQAVLVSCPNGREKPAANYGYEARGTPRAGMHYYAASSSVGLRLLDGLPYACRPQCRLIDPPSCAARS